VKTVTNHGATVPETSTSQAGSCCGEGEGCTSPTCTGYPASDPKPAAIFVGVAEPMPKYPIDEKTLADLEKRFTYHAPQADQPARYVLLRTVGKLLARKIVENTPKSREQSLALTHLEEALFWANAGIARNE
jgi:hypothetical protein